MGFFNLIDWQPAYSARLLVVLVVFLVGSLPPPRPAPAALRQAEDRARESTNNTFFSPSSPAPKAPVFPFMIAKAPRRTDEPAKPAAGQPPNPDRSGVSPMSPATPTDTRPQKIVGGWLPFWDINEGMRIVNEFPDALTEVSPFWYEVAQDGKIVNSPGAENNDVLTKIKSQGKIIIPTIMSADGPTVSSVLNDEAKRSLHLKQVMRKVKNRFYDGIDIDYENLPAADKDVFSLFIRELAPRVHRQGKKLVVTVNSKTSDPGDWNGAQSHDYAAIGEAADQVRIMAYDQHYSGGPPGPVAGIDWVKKVVTFSLEKIPKEKIVLGIPAYGYDWPAGGRAKSLVHDDAAAKSLATQAPIQWDVQSASSYFQYADESGAHTVWFENKASLEAKFDLAKRFQLAGIAIWRLGREDKTAYLAIRSKYLSP